MEFWIKEKYFILFLEIALILYLYLISFPCKEKIFFVMEVSKNFYYFLFSICWEFISKFAIGIMGKMNVGK